MVANGENDVCDPPENPSKHTDLNVEIHHLPGILQSLHFLCPNAWMRLGPLQAKNCLLYSSPYDRQCAMPALHRNGKNSLPTCGETMVTTTYSLVRRRKNNGVKK